MRRASSRLLAERLASGALAAIGYSCLTAAAPVAAQPAPVREVPVTLPLMDGPLYLGDVDGTITVDQVVAVPTERLLALVEPRLDTAAAERLRTRLAGLPLVRIGPGLEFEFGLAYDPRRLELVLAIPPRLRARQDISLVSAIGDGVGATERPAGFSAFLTARPSVDYVHQSAGGDSGFGDATIILLSAARAGGLVAETLARWRPGDPDADFQRQASRLIYDQLESPFRITAGDLLIVSRSFQSAPDAAGVSILRSYQLLQPMRIARPSGARSFQLTTASTVEILVNGRSTRRLRLEPGNYDLRDFPFTQGANDIRVVVDEGAGPREALRYNMFYDAAQLQSGLDEFGLWAGVRSQLGPSGPVYSDDWLASGYYRRGLSDLVTLGVNGQADARTAMAGVELLWSSPIGLFGGELAASRADRFGMGWAASLFFQRLFSGAGALTFTFETQSRRFAPLGAFPPVNQTAWEATAGWSRSLSGRLYVGVDLSYTKGRGDEPDRSFYRANAGYQLTPRLNLDVNGAYERSPEYRGFSFFVSLTARLGPRVTAQAEYDGRYQRGRLAVAAYHGEEVGSWNLGADASHGADGGALNGYFDYSVERAVLGVSHFTTWDDNLSSIVDQRSSLRAAFAIAFADGALALSRPILNGFAILEPHDALGAEIVVNPTDDGHLARSDWLGPAVVPNLTAFSERLLYVEAPDAHAGYDIGSGRYRVVTPYHGGYRIVVGSDYGMTAQGSLLRADGELLVLIAGTATEAAAPEREPITFFTNREGLFSLSGLRPGRWRLEMLTEPPTVYVVEIAESSDPIVQLGALVPEETP